MAEPIAAGVSYGGMKETYAVKILVCYLLSAMKVPLTLENICEICTEEGIVDYFTLCTAIDELEKNGNLSPGTDGEGAAGYILTPLGLETVENLKKALPTSLRDLIVRRGMALLARLRREQEIVTDIQPDGSGYQVTCTLHEGELTFFSLSFYAPDQEQARIIAENFFAQAPELYQALVRTLARGEGRP